VEGGVLSAAVRANGEQNLAQFAAAPFSPDGGAVAFASGRDAYIVDISGAAVSAPQRLGPAVDDGAVDGRMVEWSSDSAQIGFMRQPYSTAATELVVADALNPTSSLIGITSLSCAPTCSRVFSFKFQP
jgi:hypothetical protein